MSTLDAVLSRIDQDLDASVERLFALLRIPSVSTDPAYKEHCRTAAKHVADDLASIGFSSEVRPTGGHPVVIAKANGDDASARKYFETGLNWSRELERWTVTESGDAVGHYLRITADGNPNDGSKMEINSSSRIVDEREVLDAGFLELVRIGLKRPRDPVILESLKRIDRLIKVRTPMGDAWYRYNHDAYGETPDGGKYDGRNGVGRLWTLLTGERGEYDVAAGNIAFARKRLDTLAGFANDGLMIPEQVWDRRESPGSRFRFGAGTGSATPLAWSMAQFIRLAINIERRRNVEAPRPNIKMTRIRERFTFSHALRKNSSVIR